MPEPLRPFVLLRHELSGAVHWDLMLDHGDRLATWQLVDDPRALVSGTPPAAIRARRLPDHRRAYLDYEGPVSADRGFVTRLDRGEYVALERDRRRWIVRLAGSRLSGTFRLRASGGPEEPWELERLAI